MRMTEEQGRKFWSTWMLSKSLKAEGRPEVFARALANRLRAKLVPSEETPHCLTWRTSRPVPGVGSEHETVVVAAATTSGADNEVLDEIRHLVSSSDVAMVFPIGQEGTLIRRLRPSILALLVLERESAERLLWGNEDVTFILHDVIRRNASDGLRARLNPYWTQGPVGGRMFYGRSREIGKLLSEAGSGVAVIGPRGIGKSSLLLSVREIAPTNTVAVYVNCEIHDTPESLLKYVMGQLFPQTKAAGNTHPLHEMPGRTARRIILLIDEADPLIEHCDTDRRTDFYGDLKSFSTSGGKLIMAGYRQFRDAVLRPTHNLFQTMERLSLLPFPEGSDDARALIVDPMAERGLGYDDEDEAVGTIMQWSSGHPLFIQLYCQRVMDLCLARSRSVIDQQIIESVRHDSQIYHCVIDTFNHTTDAMEKCVTYAAISCGSEFDQAAIMEVLLGKWAFRPNMNRVIDACETLVLANIFTQRERKYSFLFNALPQLMKAHTSIDRIMPYLVEDAKRETAV